MKKILLLGGSAQQIVAIETAKNLGFYTVLCDYLIDNPGQYVADKYYPVSTTDVNEVIKVAMAEKIDGIIAYASDPAAPTAAFVAEKLGLPTNPYNSVKILCNKDKFREFLRSNNFNTPFAKSYNNNEIDVSLFKLPVIIKPVDSSGSKGATVLYEWDNLEKAVEFAFSFSRSHRIIVEEYIEKKHEYLVGGDVFVNDGKIVLWGLLNCHRDNKVNQLVPVGKSYPLLLDKQDEEVIKSTLQNMVDKLNIIFGSINVELIVDKNNEVWLIDVGPRAGGNMIPDLLGIIFGVNVVEKSILTAMGDDVIINAHNKKQYIATHNIHTDKNGIYKTIEFSEVIEKKIIKKFLYKKRGDKVEYFNDASKALGIIFMRFEDQKDMTETLEKINDHYNVVLE